MLTTMMDFPLSTQMILRHGSQIHAGSRVGTSNGYAFQFTFFADIATRIHKLAGALTALGVTRNARIATYCWNHQQHLECYLAIPSMGAVLHTLNVRLFPEQVVGIMNHAEDSVLIIDGSLLPQIEAVLKKVPSLRHIIVIGDGWKSPSKSDAIEIQRYESLLERSAPIDAWPELDEKQAAVVCFTSGTTGAPKAWFTVIVRYSCIPSLHSAAILSAYVSQIESFYYPRCFMPMLGGCPSRPGCQAQISCFPHPTSKLPISAAPSYMSVQLSRRSYRL